MAGPVVAPIPIAASRERQPAFSRRNIVEASVSLMGRQFRTSIREGASAEELIEKVAKENGGGVARVFYPEFNTWEIVAVKIGDRILVKDSPEKVAGADFSQFGDPDQMRRAAVAASHRSSGGIHFSLGSSGIPIAVTAGQEIVFPNAEELRVGRNTRDIALWMTEFNANPLSLADLGRGYAGGVSLSEEARRRIEESHGGMRSEKLMLEENLLVLNKDTGQILTASQFAADQRPAPDLQFISARPIQDCPPAFVAGLPMDGMMMKLPYFFIKTFDGAVSDLISVRFNPLIQPVEAPLQLQAAPADPAGRKIPLIRGIAQKLRFTVLRFDDPKALRPDKTQPIDHARADRREIPRTDDPCPEALPAQKIVRSWSLPRSARIDLGIPSSARPIELPRPVPSGRLEAPRKDHVQKSAVSSKDLPAPSPAGRPAPRLVRPQKQRANPSKRESRKESGPRQIDAKPLRGKVRKANLRPSPSGKPVTAPLMPKAPKKQAKKRDTEKRSIPSSKRKVPPAQLTREAMAKSRTSPFMRDVRKTKKKPDPSLIRDLIGLFGNQWKKRGRKLSTKKNRAA
ncbi:MAG: hypothetical protein U0R44_04210 [Candidatus Micrarchaeia archaeon]